MGSKIILLLSILILFSCGKDDELIPIPDEVQISICQIDQTKSFITFCSSQVNAGLTGTWTIENSNGEIISGFQNINDPSTKLTCDPTKYYKIKWSVSNGKESVFDQIIIKLNDINTFLEVGVSFETLLKSDFTINHFIKAGIELQQLIDEGIMIQELLAIGILPSEIYKKTNSSAEDFLSAELALKDVVLLGFFVGDFLDLGYTIEELVATQATFVEDFRKANVTDIVLKEQGLIGTLLDFEGNSYEWVKIGSQKWMAENLRATVDNNGNAIHSFVYDDKSENETIYGRLYKSPFGLCPQGWHLSTDNEWDQLVNFLGKGGRANSLLRSSGILTDESGLWEDSPTRGSNRSAFNALPAGLYKLDDEIFSGLGTATHFHMANTKNEPEYQHYVLYHTGSIGITTFRSCDAYSIRCVCDE